MKVIFNRDVKYITYAKFIFKIHRDTRGKAGEEKTVFVEGASASSYHLIISS